MLDHAIWGVSCKCAYALIQHLCKLITGYSRLGTKPMHNQDAGVQ